MRNKIFYFIGAAFVLAAGIFLAVYWGLTPKPVPKIKLSQFISSEEVASSVLLRLRNEIKDAPVLFLGIWPEEPLSFEVWSSIVSQIQTKEENEGLKYDAIIIDPQIIEMSPTTVWPEHETASLMNHYEQITQGLKAAKDGNKRLIFIVPSTHSSQIIQNSPIDRLKDELKIQVTSFSIAPFVLSAAELKNSPVPCKGNIDEKVGTSAFGCAISYVSQLNRNKAVKLSQDKITGLMSQFALKDYMLFLRR
ncbi:MAG: hypothetical protein AB7O96_01665 [Pseudobdellovibrionaceae bacterium]